MAQLKVDDRAPEFRLKDQQGVIQELPGEGVTVLYFYPKDDTPGCTLEACDFQAASGRLQELGARVLGVSPDSTESHGQFAAKYSLRFPLLADPEKIVSTAYGVWVKKQGKDGHEYMGIERTTYVLAGGKVRAVFPSVKVDGHVEEVLKSLHAPKPVPTSRKS